MMDITWQKILGHEENIRELRRGLKRGTLPHGLLFDGASGVGKRKTAMTLAAALLCGKGDEACGRCPSCLAFQKESHPDFLTVKPEAKGKATPIIRIEDIRGMQSQIATFPVMEQGRVVIIDDAQTMNAAAANSLLKTLEEPVGKVTFILLADSRASLLETIVSRCNPMRFGILTAEQVEKFLLEQGKPPEEAQILANLSGGSIGEALSRPGEEVIKLQGDVFSYVKSLRRFSAKELWQRSQALGDKKEYILTWLTYLYMMLRDILILQVGKSEELIFHRNLTAQLQGLDADFPPARLFAWLKLVEEHHRRLGSNLNLRLAVENFLVRMGEVK